MHAIELARSRRQDLSDRDSPASGHDPIVGSESEDGLLSSMGLAGTRWNCPEKPHAANTDPLPSLLVAQYHRLRSVLRHRPHPRHDVHRQGSVPARSGRRQLRRARNGQAGDAQGDRRQPHPLPADHRHAAAAGAVAEKLRKTNGIPIGAPDEVLVTNGGIHALYILCHALLEPGDEVIVPDPEWPPSMGNVKAAPACRCHVRCTKSSAGAGISTSSSEDHAEDTRDLHQLAEQPDRRRPDARPTSSGSRRSPTSATCG